MDDFPDEIGQLDIEVAVLKEQLAQLVRKMFQRNIFVENEISSILRGLSYEERLALPPPCERH